MSLHLINFFRTPGAKNKKPRIRLLSRKAFQDRQKKNLLYGLGTTGIYGATALYWARKGKISGEVKDFSRWVANSSSATKTELFDRFTQMSKAARRNIVRISNKTPNGRNLKRFLRQGYREKTGLTDDLSRIRAAKAHAYRGDIAGQKDFGERIIQRARDKAVNKGKSFKEIRRDMRDKLQFSNTNEFLIDF